MKRTVSALRECNFVVTKMDLQFVKMCGDPSTAMHVLSLEVGLVDGGRAKLISKGMFPWALSKS